MALLLLGRKKKPEKYPPKAKTYIHEIYFFTVYFIDLTFPCWSLKKNICPEVVYKIKNKKKVIIFGGADLRCVHLNWYRVSDL